MAHEQKPPKVFISYAHTSAEHKDRVRTIATRLRESGIDAILDQWDLQEGHDVNAYMESMITDDSVDKVLMVVDQDYATKANKRQGGVGAETQILTPELYGQIQQNKFIALAMDHDRDGNPLLPTFYKSRIAILHSNPDWFEQLLRAIYNKPLHEKPPLGKPPTYITVDNAVPIIPTTTPYYEVIDAIKQGKTSVIRGRLVTYLETLSKGIKSFEIKNNHGFDYVDEAIVDSINLFLPYRNEFIDILIQLSNYRPNIDYETPFHSFFETAVKDDDSFQFATSGNLSQDSIKFIYDELFLYTIAVWLKNEEFDRTDGFLSQTFYNSRYRNTLFYTVFRHYFKSLDTHRNQRLKLNRLSVKTDMLKERADRTDIEFEHVMQADAVLYVRSIVKKLDLWYPSTLIYRQWRNDPSEIVTKSRSCAYFTKIIKLIGLDGDAVTAKQALVDLASKSDYHRIRVGRDNVSVDNVMDLQHLATVP